MMKPEEYCPECQRPEVFRMGQIFRCILGHHWRVGEGTKDQTPS